MSRRIHNTSHLATARCFARGTIITSHEYVCHFYQTQTLLLWNWHLGNHIGTQPTLGTYPISHPMLFYGFWHHAKKSWQAANRTPPDPTQSQPDPCCPPVMRNGSKTHIFPFQLLRAILICGTEKHSWTICSALEFDLFYIHVLPIRYHQILWQGPLFDWSK